MIYIVTYSDILQPRSQAMCSLWACFNCAGVGTFSMFPSPAQLKYIRADGLGPIIKMRTRGRPGTEAIY